MRSCVPKCGADSDLRHRIWALLTNRHLIGNRLLILPQIARWTHSESLIETAPPRVDVLVGRASPRAALDAVPGSRRGSLPSFQILAKRPGVRQSSAALVGAGKGCTVFRVISPRRGPALQSSPLTKAVTSSTL